MRRTPFCAPGSEQPAGSAHTHEEGQVKHPRRGTGRISEENVHGAWIQGGKCSWLTKRAFPLGMCTNAPCPPVSVRSPSNTENSPSSTHEEGHPGRGTRRGTGRIREENLHGAWIQSGKCSWLTRRAPGLTRKTERGQTSSTSADCFSRRQLQKCYKWLK